MLAGRDLNRISLVVDTNVLPQKPLSPFCSFEIPLACEDAHDRGGAAVLDLRVGLPLEDARLLRPLHQPQPVHGDHHRRRLPF